MATTAVTGTAANTGLNSINLDSFLKIVLAQLTYQDPLKPVDSAQFITQLAQITSLEQTRQLTVSVDSMLSAQTSTELIGLLGKTVEVSSGLAANGSTTTTTGTVTDVTFSSGTPQFTLTTTAGEVMTNVTASQLVRVPKP